MTHVPRQDPTLFDAWLKRDLTTRFAGALNDPVPDEIIRLMRWPSDRC